MSVCRVQVSKYTDLILVEEKEVTSKYEALSWLQWIAKRSKLTTTSVPDIKMTSTLNPPKDPFSELLSQSKLDFPGPPIQSSTSETTSSPTKLTTIGPTTSPSPTTSSTSTVQNLKFGSFLAKSQIYENGHFF